jgi:hypothetical protein
MLVLFPCPFSSSTLSLRLILASRSLLTLFCLCRIIEIEWAVKNNTAFVPSPKKPRKQREGKKPKSKLAQEFGVEVTNTAASSSNEHLVATKRAHEDSEDPLVNKVQFPGTASPITQTPMKRQRRDAVGLVDDL